MTGGTVPRKHPLRRFPLFTSSGTLGGRSSSSAYFTTPANTLRACSSRTCPSSEGTGLLIRLLSRRGHSGSRCRPRPFHVVLPLLGAAGSFFRSRRAKSSVHGWTLPQKFRRRFAASRNSAEQPGTIFRFKTSILTALLHFGAKVPFVNVREALDHVAAGNGEASLRCDDFDVETSGGRVQIVRRFAKARAGRYDTAERKEFFCTVAVLRALAHGNWSLKDPNALTSDPDRGLSLSDLL